MGIYWRGRGKEKAAWGRIRIAGQEYRGPLGTKSKRDAPAAYQIWLADIKKDLANPGDAASATTWRDAVWHFLEHHFPTLKQSTQVRYLQSIETLTPHFERQTLQALRKADFAKFVSYRRRAGKLSRHKGATLTVSDGTILRDLQCVSAIFTCAADFDLCENNPARAYMQAMMHRGVLQNAAPSKRYLVDAQPL